MIYIYKINPIKAQLLTPLHPTKGIIPPCKNELTANVHFGYTYLFAVAKLVITNLQKLVKCKCL